MEKKLKDILKTGTNKDLKILYLQKIKNFEEKREFLIENSTRSDLQLVIENFIIRTIKEINRIRDNVENDIEILAWSTRNLYELKVTLKYVFEAEERFNLWIKERGHDEKEILEGFLTLAESDTPKKEIEKIKGRIEELESISRNIHPALQKLKPIRELAKERIEDHSDHRAFYKLLSKYVHPSSWLLNASEEDTNSFEYRNIFIIKSQLFAAEIEEIIDRIVGSKNGA